MKRHIITIMIILLANMAFSQDFSDVLRYSQTNYGGTARSIAMGSAFGSLGGDFSSASINPAGLGLYRSGEFTLSPTLTINNASSDYLGTNSTDNKYHFNLDNLSYVGAIQTGVESGIVGFSFGLGFNRLKNFNSNVSVVGHGATTSLLNYYTDWANSLGNPGDFDPLYEGLAYDTWLIDYSDDNSAYYNDFNFSETKDGNGNVTSKTFNPSTAWEHSQLRNTETSGRIDEYVMSLGLNANHRLYIGASVSLLDLEYRENTTFIEVDDQNKSEYFNKYTQQHYLNHSGVGANFKAGIIYRPSKSLRLGLAVHTPNFYTITCSENNRIIANYDLEIDGSKYHDLTSTPEPYSFELQTPFKAVASASYLLGNKGLLSVDYEWVNYKGSKLRDASDNYDYSEKNTVIQGVFHSAGNLRVGGEFRATDNFSLRAGFQYLGNPWASNYNSAELANKNDSYMTYSAGFGYRQQNFFIDFAYRLSDINEAYKVHEMSATDPLNGKNIADVNYLNSQATLTVGFRF